MAPISAHFLVYDDDDFFKSNQIKFIFSVAENNKHNTKVKI